MILMFEGIKGGTRLCSSVSVHSGLQCGLMAGSHTVLGCLFRYVLWVLLYSSTVQQHAVWVEQWQAMERAYSGGTRLHPLRGPDL